jgi:hypothetical protein
LIGKSSGGYEFVFIEFEHPNYPSILKSGSPAEPFRKGIEQAVDWRIWLEANFSSLRNTFHIYKNFRLARVSRRVLMLKKTSILDVEIISIW